MILICKFWFNLNLKFQMTSAVDMCSSSSNSLTYTYARDIECLLDSDQLIVDQKMMKKKMVRLELVHHSARVWSLLVTTTATTATASTTTLTNTTTTTATTNTTNTTTTYYH